MSIDLFEQAKLLRKAWGLEKDPNKRISIQEEFDRIRKLSGKVECYCGCKKDVYEVDKYFPYATKECHQKYSGEQPIAKKRPTIDQMRKRLLEMARDEHVKGNTI